MSKPIKSIDALVDALGGTAAVARFLDVVPSAVSNWKTQGWVPPGYHFRIHLEAELLGLDVAPSVFNLNEWPTKPATGGTRKPRGNGRRSEVRVA